MSKYEQFIALIKAKGIKIDKEDETFLSKYESEFEFTFMNKSISSVCEEVISKLPVKELWVETEELWMFCNPNFSIGYETFVFSFMGWIGTYYTEKQVLSLVKMK